MYFIYLIYNISVYTWVSEVEEGGSYWARVECGGAGGGLGGGGVRVPEYARLRGVAVGSAAAALLLAALAAALCLARRRLRPHALDKRTRWRAHLACALSYGHSCNTVIVNYSNSLYITYR